MGAKIQAFDIFQTPLSSHYPLPLNEESYHLQQHPHLLPGRPEVVEGAGSSLQNRTEFKGTFSRDFEPSTPASPAGALGGGRVEKNSI